MEKRSLKNKKFMIQAKKDRSKFFNEVAKHCSFADLGSIQDFYYGLLRTILKELEEVGVVYLPDFGKFKMRTLKSKKIFMVRSRTMADMGERRNILFQASTKLKQSINRKKVSTLPVV